MMYAIFDIRKLKYCFERVRGGESMDGLTLRTGHKNFSYQAPFTFSTSQQPEALVTRWALLLKRRFCFVRYH